MPKPPKGLVELQLELLIITYKSKIHLINTQCETQHVPI